MENVQPDAALSKFLFSSGLADTMEEPIWEPLAGGVSSDIWKVSLLNRTLCIKRALPKLKVAADWYAPVSRNSQEWAWLQFSHRHCPDNVPAPLAHDEKAGILAMEYLEPDAHPVWKQQLMKGTVLPDTAARVGSLLVELHRRSAKSQDVARTFDFMSTFYALRLEPYLVATSVCHPSIAHTIMKLVYEQSEARIALVHGDVSPKNILIGPDGPVLLDAECACFGDPSFDLAFCLNHLLLKCLVSTSDRGELDRSARRLAEAYLRGVDWEEPTACERRAARLLPALILARIDGKSPVEYITRQEDKRFVRSFALDALGRDDLGLTDLIGNWHKALSKEGG